MSCVRAESGVEFWDWLERWTKNQIGLAPCQVEGCVWIRSSDRLVALSVQTIADQ